MLLDVMMPRMDGYAVCREIRAAGPAAPPVIFVTAHGNVEDRVTGLDLGAVDYLVKPFNPPELEARVRAALRTKAALDALAADGATDALTGFLSRRQVAGRTEGGGGPRPAPPAPPVLPHPGRRRTSRTWSSGTAAGAGDVLLREVARRLREISRRSDVVARYGEAAFLLLLPETDEAGACAAAERLRVGLEGIPVPLPGFCPPLRISAGVAALTPDLQDGPALLRRRGAGPGPGAGDGPGAGAAGDVTGAGAPALPGRSEPRGGLSASDQARRSAVRSSSPLRRAGH